MLRGAGGRVATGPPAVYGRIGWTARSRWPRAFPELMGIGRSILAWSRSTDVELFRARGRGHRPDRREWRRQVDADEDPRRRRRAERRHHRDRRRRAAAPDRRATRSRRASPSSIRNSISSTISMSRPMSSSAASPCMAGRCSSSTASGCMRRCGRSSNVSAQISARYAGRRTVARAAATGRDRQGAVARCAPRHHGRADLQPDATETERLLRVIAA